MAHSPHITSSDHSVFSFDLQMSYVVDLFPPRNISMQLPFLPEPFLVHVFIGLGGSMVVHPRLNISLGQATRASSDDHCDGSNFLLQRTGAGALHEMWVHFTGEHYIEIGADRALARIMNERGRYVDIRRNDKCTHPVRVT